MNLKKRNQHMNRVRAGSVELRNNPRVPNPEARGLSWDICELVAMTHLNLFLNDVEHHDKTDEPDEGGEG